MENVMDYTLYHLMYIQ